MPWANPSNAPTMSARCRLARASRRENPVASMAMNATTNSRNSMLEKTAATPASRSATSAATLAKLIFPRAAWSWSGPTPSEPSQTRRLLANAVKLSW